MKNTGNSKTEVSESVQWGSVCAKGDKVKFKYWEDDFHQAYAYGTVDSKLNDTIAIVKVILHGRTKDIIEYHEVPIKDLEPHFADEVEEEDYDELEAV